MVPYRALVDRWSRQVLVYFIGLPGCQVSVWASDDHLAASPPIIREHLRWLARHGIGDGPDDEIEVLVEEDRSAVGGIGAIFESDLPLPSPEYVERAYAVSSATLVDLLDLLPSDDPRKTVRLADSTGEPVTLAGVIKHVAEMDRYYLGSLGLGEASPLPADTAEAVRTTFREVADLIESPFISENRRLSDGDSEDWTPMKFLRRRTGHIREHEPEIAQLLR